MHNPHIVTNQPQPKVFYFRVFVRSSILSKFFGGEIHFHSIMMYWLHAKFDIQGHFVYLLLKMLSILFTSTYGSQIFNGCFDDTFLKHDIPS